MKRILLLAAMLSTLAFGQAAEPTADELFQEVSKASQQFDKAKMEFWLREMYSRYPKDLRGSVVLLDVLESSNRLAEALKLAVELRAQPETVTYWRYRAAVGRIYFKQSRFANAIDEFKASLRYAKSDYEAGASWNLLAQAYHQAGEIDEAIIAFREWKEVSGLASPFLAMALKTKGDREGAIAEYRAVLAKDPNQTLALNNLAYLFAESGQNLDEALSLARHAVQVAPGSSAYVDTLGWVLFKQGKLAEAESEQLRAMGMEGGTTGSLPEHLAIIMDTRAVWTQERKEVRELLDSDLSPRRMARFKELLGKLQ